MAGGCGESPYKKEKSKSGCPESKSSKSGCPESKSSKTGKDSFGRQLCQQEEKEGPECHESQKKFFEKDDRKSEAKKYENQCKEQKEEKNCEDAYKKANKPYKCKSTGSDCCFSASKATQTTCAKRHDSSKKSATCKSSEKQYVVPVQKPKPPLSDNTFKLPEIPMMVMRPCLPKVEKSVFAKRKRKIPCNPVKPANDCPHLKKSRFAEFFCIDARNKQMTECIKHYMTTDPSQVLVQCSQLARKRMHTVSQEQPPGLGFLPPKYRQIARRWLPAAGLYMVATAAVAVWVTEWGPIVNHIPYYKDKEKVIPLSPESPVPEFIPLVPEPPPEYYDELDDSPQDEPMELSPPESHHSPPEPQPSPPESQPSPPQSQPSPPQSQDPPSESHSK